MDGWHRLHMTSVIRCRRSVLCQRASSEIKHTLRLLSGQKKVVCMAQKHDVSMTYDSSQLEKKNLSKTWCYYIIEGGILLALQDFLTQAFGKKIYLRLMILKVKQMRNVRNIH
jgi:hypothetical protein